MSTPKVFKKLEEFALLVPVPFYWADLNCIVMGVNEPLTGLCIDKNLANNLIGKSAHDLYTPETAAMIEEHSKLVMQTGKKLTFEEMYILLTGETQHVIATRSPLFEDGKAVGLAGFLTDITASKENELHKEQIKEQLKFKKIVDQAAHDNVQSPLTILLVLAQQCSGLTKEKVFEVLKTSTAFIPVSIYWLDTNNKVVGANKSTVEAIGGKSIDDFIGKTPYEYYPHEMADNIVQHNNKVMRTRKVLSQEEPIKDATTGATKYFMAYKTTLLDNNDEVIGILGASANITAEKEAENLKLENERQKAKIEEQEKFGEVVVQMVHDIRTPLATMGMKLQFYAKDMPENMRVDMNWAVTNIFDVANDVLDRFKHDGKDVDLEEEQRPSMISMMLSQALSAKRYQYKDAPIKFVDDFCQGSAFVFIKVQSSHFVRMISNIINNAVEAFEGKKGTVRLGLSISDGNAVVTIQDNGKGMPKEIVDKILSDAHVTTDKKDGHGIGLTQIRETIKRNQGKFNVESTPGEGTKFILTFKVVEQPDWIAAVIKLNNGDTVVVLDDDTSIHGAWDDRLKNCAGIQIKHFTLGNDAIDFINAFPQKDKIFLLTDYELLKQNVTGIDVIKKTDIKRSVLVTSHYAEKKIYKLLVENRVKLLPKQLAAEVPIEVCEAKTERCVTNSDKKCNKVSSSEKVDVIIVEDKRDLADTEGHFFENHGKKVAVYYNPDDLLKDTSKYDKDVIACIDHEFEGNKLNGFDVLKQLHEQGFTRLYLFSGRTFTKEEVPDYLTAIVKTDIDALTKLAES
ncbi:MAG: PAS domain-containing protein [bacterium]